MIRSTILVEKVDEMNGAVTAEYLDKMVKREAAIVGNKELAIDTLCRRRKGGQDTHGERGQ